MLGIPKQRESDFGLWSKPTWGKLECLHQFAPHYITIIRIFEQKLQDFPQVSAGFGPLAPKPAFFSDHAFANISDFIDALDVIILRPLFGSGPHPLLWIVL